MVNYVEFGCLNLVAVCGSGCAAVLRFKKRHEGKMGYSRQPHDYDVDEIRLRRLILLGLGGGKSCA